MPCAQRSSPPRLLALSLGLAGLHRSIVSLPDRLTERDRPLQERIVFFVKPVGVHPGDHLQSLLAKLWDEDTTTWCESGFIYNTSPASELLQDYAGFSTPANPDLHLFEVGWGGPDGIGPQHVHYARAADCDLLVPPRLHKRLAAALAQIEALYAATAQVRS